jgi:hypothetical protein
VSTLDERINRDCQRSGVAFHVEDERVLDMVADRLTDNASGPAVGHRTAPRPSAAAKKQKGLGAHHATTA